MVILHAQSLRFPLISKIPLRDGFKDVRPEVYTAS